MKILLIKIIFVYYLKFILVIATSSTGNIETNNDLNELNNSLNYGNNKEKFQSKINKVFFLICN